jgi:hypothetical protein
VKHLSHEVEHDRERRLIAALFFDEVENIFPKLADGLGRLSDT